MKVLLLEDIDNLGYAGEVKKVANGYGRNYLLPQGMAVLATPGALKQAETIRKAAEKKRAQQQADANAIANQLGGQTLTFERRAGETGRLYGSVTSADIAEDIESRTGIAIDKRKIALGEPIRELGVQDVSIKLMIDVTTTIHVEVLPEGGILEKERLEEEEEEVEAEETAEEPVAEAEAPAEETPAEEPVAEVEAPAEETPAEEPVAEVEAPAEETPAEEPVAEVEAPAEETPAEEPEEEPDVEAEEEPEEKTE